MFKVVSASVKENITGPLQVASSSSVLGATDVILHLQSENGTKSVSCHKSVLSGASSYFSALFNAGFQESVQSEIALQNVNSGAAFLLLSALYESILPAPSCSPSPVPRDPYGLVDALILADQWHIDSSRTGPLILEVRSALSHALEKGDMLFLSKAATLPSHYLSSLLWSLDWTQATEGQLTRGAAMVALQTTLDLSQNPALAANRIRILISQAAQFNVINLQDATGLTGDLLNEIAQKSVTLIYLNLGNTPGLTDTIAADFAQRCSSLYFLNLAGQRSLSDPVFCLFAEKSSGLTYLNLYQCSNVSDQTLKRLAERSGLLTTLNLGFCTHCTSGTFNAFIPRLKNVEALDLSGLSLNDETVKRLASQITRLRELSLAKCQTWSDTAIRALAEKTHELSGLSLVNCQVSDETLVVFAKNAGKLKTLLLQNCSKIKPATLTLFAEKSSGISILGLAGCRNSTDYILLLFAQQAGSLRYLDVRSTTTLSQWTIAQFRSKCPTGATVMGL